MKYHDYRLDEYTVTKSGSEIILRLIYNYPNRPIEQSAIHFSDVAIYHFIHTGGAIITEIMDVPLPRIFSEYGKQIANWWHMIGGFPHWRDDQTEYIEVLKENGYSGWLIDSAIGFQGFVIARSMGEDACNS